MLFNQSDGGSTQINFRTEDEINRTQFFSKITFQFFQTLQYHGVFLLSTALAKLFARSLARRCKAASSSEKNSRTFAFNT
jgi:hypothetical protein